MTTVNKQIFKNHDKYESTDPLLWAFPEVDPGIKPLGTKVLVQIRRPRLKIGSIILNANSAEVEAEKWYTQIGKVIAVGPVAFRNRDTLEPWPEGSGIKQGDFVRIPKLGKDQWQVPVDEDSSNDALFCLVNDHEIIGLVTTDPLKIKAFM